MTKSPYITTPIYYVNDVPHIGHSYTTIAADVWARWKRLKGESVHFLTGTDEHGAKIANMASQQGVEPLAFADGITVKFQALWKRLNISNDDFIRTTEPRHEKVVQGIFEKLKTSGDIVKGVYEDWYCVPDETFWSETQLVDKKCPDCGRPVEKLQEETYFFHLEKYKDRLSAFYDANPGFLQPAYRASEIRNFVKELKKLSVSRTKVKWGVPVTSDPSHTVYVWFDALINYVSAVGYDPEKPWSTQSEKTRSVWPADVHLVGKEIFRFHAVIWPAMLMALGFTDDLLPRMVFAHGWWTVEGEKMSKSRGNVVDPHKIIEEFGGDALGVDVLRYFVLREVPFGNDGDFSQKALLGRYNSELANALGNLLNRTLTLMEKYTAGKIDDHTPDHSLEEVKKINAAMNRLAFHEVLESVNLIVRESNQRMDQEAPWKTAKTDLGKARKTFYHVLVSLKKTAILLHPFMPTVTREIWRQLGETGSIAEAGRRYLNEGLIAFADGQTVVKGAPLFPRKDVA